MNLKSLRNPDLYHGRLSKNYFEGRYFKLVDSKLKRVFAFIPGIFFSSHPENDHAFIYVVDGTKITYGYERFSTTAFSASKNTFALSIDENEFGINGIKLNLAAAGSKIHGELGFSNHFFWPDSLLNPGSMGFYN